MAKQSNPSRRGRETDSSLEALKPLVVLALFGMILYGAYTVVQKGPAPVAEFADGVAEAPVFQPPAVQLAATSAVDMPAPPVEPVPQPGGDTPAPAQPAPPPVAEVSIPAPTEPSPQAAADVPLTSAGPGNPGPGSLDPATLPPGNEAATYLTAESAAPPVAAPVAATPPALPPTMPATTIPPDRYASLPTNQLPPGLMPSPNADAAALAAGAAPAASVFAAAWTDAQEKLVAGRWAEALGTLSVWYDDPSLGLEESQRLEDILGQLAGTVIYSQQDLLLPPHVVAAGETLPSIAAPLGVSWRLLAKINGIDDPQMLVPGEQLKLVRGPFDAVVSLSRRRLSLQLGGSFAGSFPVTIGRQFLDRVGGSLPVVSVQRGGAEAATLPGAPAPKAAVVLGDGMAIETADPSSFAGDTAPQASLIVAPHDLAELVDILGPGSRVLVRQ
jgi:hypothetical protein